MGDKTRTLELLDNIAVAGVFFIFGLTYILAKNYFARGQFQKMSDAQKLSRPSFDKMDAGVSKKDLAKAVRDYVEALNNYNSMLDAETILLTEEIIDAGERVEELHKKWRDAWLTYKRQKKDW